MRALVTGAAHGLGRALTEQLLDAGYEVVAVDRDTDALDVLAVRSRGACTVRLADMSNPESLDRLLARLTEKRFDLVILNAGISATGKFEDIPANAYEKLIDVNLTAPLLLATSMVKRGQMNKKSKLVFISSLSNVVGYPGASVYAATKDAIAVYAKSIRKPFKKRGIGVLTVFPGPLRTAHAAKHAPRNAKASKRMAPDAAAKLILKAAKSNQKELYPGFAAGMAKFFSGIAPQFMTKMMKKAIYDKLDRTEY